MSKLIYSLGVIFLHTAIKFAAICNYDKAKEWFYGRKNWKNSVNNIDNTKASIWIHAASHGEGLMAIPLLKRLSVEYPKKNIIISFFSPSGFKNFNYQQKNLIKVYLPIDYKKNAEFILNTIKPEILIFVKYDFWFNLITTAQELKIPTLCFSTKVKINEWYLKSFWNWQNKSLKEFSSILTLDKTSHQNLKEKGFLNSKICGDTRYDQVSLKPNKNLFLKISKPCIIIGSSWKKEEEAINNIIEELNEFQIIIAPHDISSKRILELTSLFGNKCQLYSKISNSIPNVLIIDNIGILADLYELSKIAIIGGGFSGKLHNIIEPAAKGNHILFGPNIDKFPEAKEMVKKGLANIFNNSQELLSLIKNHKGFSSEKSKKHILNKQGATNIVFEKCKELMSYSKISASSRI